MEYCFVYRTTIGRRTLGRGTHCIRASWQYYATELLHNKEAKKALQLYEELQRCKIMFYLPGETAMALNVAEQIAKL